MKKILLILVPLFLLSACTSKYQSGKSFSGFMTGGYYNKDLGSGQVEVEFYGNGLTKTYEVQDYAYLRAAEIMYDKGYQYFGLVAYEVTDGIGGKYIPYVCEGNETYKRQKMNSDGSESYKYCKIIAEYIGLNGEDFALYKKDPYLFNEKNKYGVTIVDAYNTLDAIKNITEKYKLTNIAKKYNIK